MSDSHERTLSAPVLVWGAGAIGGTVGAYLARAGHEVLLLDRVAEHVEAIDREGLRITGPIDSFTVRAPAVTPERLEGRFGTIFLCVKAHHTAEATAMLAPHLSEDGFVLSLQNGLNERAIAAVVGEERTVGAFINFGADYQEPGVIHYGGRGAVVLGELDGRITPRLEALHALLRAFEPGARTTDNIHGYLWSKLAVGAMLFATALTDASIADAFAAPRYRPLFLAIPREVLAIALARGIRPEDFDGFQASSFLPDAPAGVAEASLAQMEAFNRRSAKTHSGIWRDLAVRRRRTEVDPQLGPIVELGAEAGREAPLTARIIELIHDLEQDRRDRGWHNLELLLDLLEPAAGG